MDNMIGFMLLMAVMWQNWLIACIAIDIKRIADNGKSNNGTNP